MSFIQYSDSFDVNCVLSIDELRNQHKDVYIDELCFSSDVGQCDVDKFVQKALQKHEVWNVNLAFLNTFSNCESSLEVRLVSPRVGLGVFTNSDIEKGSFIGEYVGLVCKENCGHYHFSFFDKSEEFNLGIDSMKNGNFTRYINHSKNSNLDVAYSLDESGFHVLFFSNQFIKSGTEIRFNYGPNYWNEDPEL